MHFARLVEQAGVDLVSRPICLDGAYTKIVFDVCCLIFDLFAYSLIFMLSLKLSPGVNMSLRMYTHTHTHTNLFNITHDILIHQSCLHIRSL